GRQHRQYPARLPISLARLHDPSSLEGGAALFGDGLSLLDGFRRKFLGRVGTSNGVVLGLVILLQRLDLVLRRGFVALGSPARQVGAQSDQAGRSAKQT